MSTKGKGGTPANPNVQATVDYLPAAAPFHGEFSPSDAVEAVRAAAMAFFGVSDHADRDTYKYWLEFEGERVQDTSVTLSTLLGEHRRGAHFNLVEEITKGTRER